MSEFKSSTSPQNEAIQRAVWVGTALAGNTFLFLALSIFLLLSTGTWQSWIFFILVLAAEATILGSIPFIQRGQLQLGGWLLLGWSLFAPLVVALTFVQMGYVAAVYILVAGFFIIRSMLPKESWNLAIALSIAASVISLSAELINPAWRQTSPLILTISPVLIITLVLALLAVIARQAWGGSMRNKLLVGFIAVTLVAAGTLSIYLFISTNNILRQNLERELTTHTNNIATRIGNLFTEQINTLTTLSLNEVLQQYVEASNQAYQGGPAAIQAELDEKDARWRAADAANNNNDLLVREHLTNAVAVDLLEYQQAFPNNIEVFVTDKYGGLAGTTNRTSDYYQADEGWWQAAYNNGQGAVYISEPEYDESANALAVLIALPLRNRETGELIGILRTTYLASALNTILGQKIGETGQADLFIPGEVVSHFHDGQLDAIDPEEYANLRAVADQGMAEIDYEDTFSVVIQTPVKTVEGNQTVDTLGWIVAFHQHQDEAFAPVNAQTRGAFLVIAIITVIAVLGAIGLSLYLVRPIIQLTQSAEEIAAGNLDSRAQVTSTDEIGTLASTFNSMTAQLQEILRGLEQRVAARTRNLELAAEVGRAVSQVRDLDSMLKDACELILKEFNLYYVQVYLTDPSQQHLLLEAGTGTVGAQLLERAHRLPLDTGSINGRAAVEKRSVVISDTTQSATFRQNPLLPETRGEMAVPLIVADKVVGVLDMQSSAPGVLSNEVLPAFEALAGQLAVAVQNANLLAETNRARAEVESQARRLVREGWVQHLDGIHKAEQIGFVFEQNQVIPLTETQPETSGNGVISAPIAVTGEPLGSLEVEADETTRSEQTSELVQIVARQVAQHIESLRLVESAERYRVEAEQAARRLTREGWEEYFNTKAGQSLSYLFDLKEVKAIAPEAAPNPEATLAVPIKVRDETIGRLAVLDIDSADPETMELVNTVTERLSEHIESLRLLEETQLGQLELNKRARQLAAVSQISTISSRELDIQKLLATVVHLTQRQFGLYHAHVFTYNEKADQLEIVACGWNEGDEHEGTHETTVIPLEQEQSLVARAARTRQPVVINDVRSDPGWLPNPLLPETASELAVPLVIGEEVLGVLDVQSDRRNAFTDEDINIQATLAAQVATSLQNARSFSRAQRQAEREALLNAISQKIQSATSVEAVLQIAARELGHALGAPRTVAQLSLKDNK